MVKKIKFLKKAVSLVAAFSVLFNSLFVPLTVLAQDVTLLPEPTETPIEASTSLPSESPIEEPILEATPSSSPTVEPFAIETPSPTNETNVEVLPAESPTQSPTSTPEPEVQGTTNENAESLAPPTLETEIVETSNPYLLTTGEESWFNLITDKLDYAPTESSVITGSGFTPNKTYKLTISSSNYPPISTTVEVVANDTGEFSYVYQLDGTYRPNYLVEVKSGSVVLATTTFTDSPAVTTTVNNIACMADQPGQTGLNCTANDISIASVSSIVINGHGCRFPGDTVSFTANWNISSNANNRYNVGLWFNTTGGSSALHGTCSSTSIPSSPAPFFDSGSGSVCGGINKNPSTGTLSITQTAVCNPDSNGFLKLPYCASWQQNTGACTGPLDTVPGAPSKCSCADGFTIPITVPPSIEVVKTLSPSDDAGIFNLQVNNITNATNVGNAGTTGKITATIGSNTIGETAGTSTSLSNYNSTVSCVLRGTQTIMGTTGTNPWTLNVSNGQDIICTITNTRINDASLTIVKDAIPNDSQDFAFTTTGTGLSDFSLDDDSDNTLSNSITFSNLAAGSYSVSETEVAGWDQTNVTCTDDSNPANIELSAGETVTCTFTNTQRGSISGYKYDDLNGDGVNDGDWTPVSGWIIELWQNQAYITETTTNGSGFYSFPNLINGVYTLIEQIVSGWTNITSSTLGVTLDAGENDQNNSFVNTQYGHIVIRKNAVPNRARDFTFNNNFGNQNPITFLLDDDSNATLSNSRSFDVLPGTYWVTENTVAGWQQESATCDNGETIDDITVASAETVTCTFTNEKLANITLVKNTVGGNDSFDFNATGTGLPTDIDLTTVNGTARQTFSNLDPDNTYSISENVPSGWDLTSATCTGTNTPNSITPNAGENITCTFTNTELGNVTVVKYNDINGNGSKDDGEETLNGWEIHLDEMSQFTGSQIAGQVTFSDLLPNSFILSEQFQEGWVQTNIACSNEIGIDNDNSHSVNLAAGENITCYVGNQGMGSVTVYKNVDTNGDGDVDIYNSDDWMFELNTNDYVMGTTVDVVAGDYSVSEFGQANYHFVSLDCEGQEIDGSTTRVSVSAGEDVICTYTNTRDTGEIIIKKIIDEDGNLETTEDQTMGVDWEIDVDGLEGDTDDSIYGNTDLNGEYKTGGIKTGRYYASETQQTGYDFISASCSDRSLVTSIELSEDETVTCTFYNTPNGTIHGYKWNDLDGNGEKGNDEVLLSGWKIFFDENDNEVWDIGEKFMLTDDGNDYGWYWFDHLFPGTYKVCEVNQNGWQQTSSPECHTISVSTLRGENTCTLPEVQNSVFGPTCNFGNMEDNPEIVIAKSNDKSDGVEVGGNVTYTLVVENTGNLYLNDLEVTDAIPGGFTYVAGTSELDGNPISDPTISGSLLKWNIGDLSQGEKATLTYQLKIGDSVLKNSTYTNFATCKAFYGGFSDNESFRVVIFEQNEVECNVTSSTVSVGTSNSYGGNLVGQVLGASIELPATGNPTGLLIFALLGLATGIYLKKKYV